MKLNNEIREKLREKVEEADMALALKSYSEDKTQWAMASLEYAQALMALGDEEQQPLAFRYYQNAAQAFENALKVYSKKKDFALWSGAMVAFAQLLRSYGQREGGEIGVFRLQRSEALIDQVLESLGSKMLLENALLKLEKGYIYQALSTTDRLEHKADHLEKAIFVFQDAKKIFRLKENFDYWAGTLFMLSITLSEYAILQNAVQARLHLKQAIENFESAYRYFYETGKQKDALQTLIELAHTQLTFYQYSEDEEKYKALVAAQDCFEMVQPHLTAIDSLSLKAHIKINCHLADILSLLAQSEETENPKILLEKAIKLYKESIALLQAESDKLNEALIKGYLGKSYSLYANLCLENDEMEMELDLRRQAIDILQQAIHEDLRKNRFIEWLSNYIELAAACHVYASKLLAPESLPYYKEAIALYEKARSFFLKKDEPLLWARLQQWQGLAHYSLAESYAKKSEEVHLYKQELEAAKYSFQEALGIFTLVDHYSEYVQLYSFVCQILVLLGTLTKDDELSKEYFLQAKDLCQHLVSLGDALADDSLEEKPVQNKGLKSVLCQTQEQDWFALKLLEFKIAIACFAYQDSLIQKDSQIDILQKATQLEALFLQECKKKKQEFCVTTRLQLVELYFSLLKFFDHEPIEEAVLLFIKDAFEDHFKALRLYESEIGCFEFQEALFKQERAYQLFLERTARTYKNSDKRKKENEKKKISFFKYCQQKLYACFKR